MRGRILLVGLAVLAVAALVLSALAVMRGNRTTGLEPTVAVPGSVSGAPSGPTSSAPSAATTPSQAGSPSATPSASASTSSDASQASQAPSGEGTIVVVGDQHTKDAAWATALQRLTGRPVVNLAEADMGFAATPSSCDRDPCANFSGLAQAVSDQHPEVIVLAPGDSDGERDLKKQVSSTVKALKAAAPDAKVVVTSSLSAASPRPEWLGKQERSISAAARDEGATVVDTSRVSGESSSYGQTQLSWNASLDFARLVAGAVR